MHRSVRLHPAHSFFRDILEKVISTSLLFTKTHIQHTDMFTNTIKVVGLDSKLDQFITTN